MIHFFQRFLGLMLLTIILLLSELISMPYLSSSCFLPAVYSELLEFFFTASQQMSSANRKLQSGRPPIDTDDSGMRMSSVPSAAS